MQQKALVVLAAVTLLGGCGGNEEAQLNPSEVGQQQAAILASGDPLVGRWYWSDSNGNNMCLRYSAGSGNGINEATNSCHVIGLPYVSNTTYAGPSVDGHRLYNYRQEFTCGSGTPYWSTMVVQNDGRVAWGGTNRVGGSPFRWDKVNVCRTVRVLAKENSLTGGVPLDTGVDVIAGQTFTIRTHINDTWSSGEADRISNANGAAPGNPHGGVYGPYSAFGQSFYYGTLVGQIGNGSYFYVGASYRQPAPASGRLYLVFWDKYAEDNYGDQVVTITR